MKELWYRQPAKVWEEALPLGNGRLGAMVFGNVEAERLQVNEESVWYGGKKDRINPDAREYLPKVRKLIREGHISAAQELMGTVLTGCPCSQNPYQILGDVKLYFRYAGVKAEDAESPDLVQPSLKPEDIQYRRSLSLEEGVCRTSYVVAGVTYLRECFISQPADCMILRFTASEKGRISFTLKQERGHFFKGVKKTYALNDDADVAKGQTEGHGSGTLMGKQQEANGVVLFGRPGEDGHAFVMMTKCQVIGGTRKVLGESLIVEDADEVLLYFGAVTQYRHSGMDYAGLEEVLCRQLEQVMTKSYEELFAEHVADHRSLFDRVELKLQEEEAADDKAVNDKAVNDKAENDKTVNDKAFCSNVISAKTENDKTNNDEARENNDIRVIKCSALPTDERLKRVQDGGVDLGLEELLFDYGRYLMIAGSRPDTLPLTLQGIWNKDFTPPWESKYTININLEMNYWPAETCNLSECHLPILALLKKMVADGRKVAREMYGCRGIVAHHNTDIHGDCAPQDLWLPATYWPMGIAWLCTHLWTHYEYTLDQAFLREAFPIMAESALYFVDALEPWGEYLVTNPSCSPENTYLLTNGDHGCVCFGPTMDNQILRDLFTICLKAWEVLQAGDAVSKGNANDGIVADDEKAEGKERGIATKKCAAELLKEIPDLGDAKELMETIDQMLTKLPPTRIGSDGRIMEWVEEYEELEPGHRHVSQLYGLYPSNQMTMDGTPELAAAARKTIETRLAHGGGHTGWSRAWIMNHYAKLWDGEAAHENILKMLSQSTYPNMFDKHPPFQIDGNFGATAAIAQMLVQSDADRVVLLPALPKAWKNGQVKGLKLVGNAEIDLAWSEGKLTCCEIRCLGDDYHTLIKYDKKCRMVALSKGEKLSFSTKNFAM
ncbi:MAG: glycoside hydrolase family 95 protein [Lachnospiraceae bacterium]|nr:glycoside hydrolase family 95 protein [Lachnospiraceae bacterium]